MGKRPPQKPSAGGQRWIGLTQDQISQLQSNGNTAQDWSEVLVTQDFDPCLVLHNRFYGKVRIGRLSRRPVEAAGVQLCTGITGSTIVSSDIGDDVAIHNCRMLYRCAVGDGAVLFDTSQVCTTESPRFGNGVPTRPQDSPVWLELINEAGGRRVLPFADMIAADALLWAGYPEDRRLLERLEELVRNDYRIPEGSYGLIAEGCRIMSCGIIRDARIGPHAVIEGAARLENVTIHSSRQEPTVIGCGVVATDAIIGPGCRIDRASTICRSVVAGNCSLDFGAGLFHSFLADNSTVHGCEVRNCLLFGNHHQHHRNSFLIAAMVLGQSNVAAGATIGSNHNSRRNDGELLAGRGFWPGLSVTVKYPSRFASFVLLATGQYDTQLDIPLPFSLVCKDSHSGRLEVMPAYWWQFNMYALARNASKFRQRDHRIVKLQPFELDPLGPDTVEEIIRGRGLLELWVAGEHLARTDQDPQAFDGPRLRQLGRQILQDRVQTPQGFELLVEGIDRSPNKTRILRPFEAYHAYGQMLIYYAVTNLLAYWQAHPDRHPLQLTCQLKGPKQDRWVNLGGQPVPEPDLDQLRQDIREGRVATWRQVHARYKAMWDRYPMLKYRHALAVLCDLLQTDQPTAPHLSQAIQSAIEIQRYICRQVRLSRAKDMQDPFRQALYRHKDQMEAVLGRLDDDPTVRSVEVQTEQFVAWAQRFSQALAGGD